MKSREMPYISDTTIALFWWKRTFFLVRCGLLSSTRQWTEPVSRRNIRLCLFFTFEDNRCGLDDYLLGLQELNVLSTVLKCGLAFSYLRGHLKSRPQSCGICLLLSRFRALFISHQPTPYRRFFLWLRVQRPQLRAHYVHRHSCTWPNRGGPGWFGAWRASAHSHQRFKTEVQDIKF